MARAKPSTKNKTEIKFPERYNVIMFNDDFTPMDFVIQLLVEVFNRSLEEAKTVTMNIHNEGQGIAGTYNFEIAEQKLSEALTVTRYNSHPLKITMEKMQ